MRDSVASFYGGYDLVARSAPVRRHISLPVLLIAVAVVVLVAFIAADVTAVQAIPAAVQVTAVSWYAGSELLTTAGGFSIHASQSVTLTLSCSQICYSFGGATVSAPFHLSGFSVSYSPIQYVNVTVTAPSGAYDGPLSITLAPPDAGALRT